MPDRRLERQVDGWFCAPDHRLSCRSFQQTFLISGGENALHSIQSSIFRLSGNSTHETHDGFGIEVRAGTNSPAVQVWPHISSDRTKGRESSSKCLPLSPECNICQEKSADDWTTDQRESLRQHLNQMSDSLSHIQSLVQDLGVTSGSCCRPRVLFRPIGTNDIKKASAVVSKSNSEWKNFANRLRCEKKKSLIKGQTEVLPLYWSEWRTTSLQADAFFHRPHQALIPRHGMAHCVH